MAQNVAQALEQDAQTLFQKLSENQDLANVLMGFLGRIVLICQQTGKPLQGVEMDGVTESAGDFRFRLNYHTLLISPPSLWTANRYDDFKHYVEARSRNLARALETNVRLVTGFREVIEAIDRFCERKRMPFRELKVKKAFITKDNRTCVIKTGKETLDRWGR